MRGGCALIDRSDVVRIKMPFPDITSNLAVNSHMYICHYVSGNTVSFVKCQTMCVMMIV